MVLLERAVKIGAATLCQQVCVISWWTDRYGFGAADEVVAEIKRESLELISCKVDIVLFDGRVSL